MPPISFADYLAAKYALDSRSLNPDVYQCLLSEIKPKTKLHWLDLGTGAAAMLRRLANVLPTESINAIGIDSDKDLLKLGETQIKQWLRNQGYSIKHQDGTLVAKTDGRQLEFRFDCRSIYDAIPAALFGNFDFVTAHTVMDLLVLSPATASIANYMTKGGLLYATLNYEGETTLIPGYQDENLENKILSHYNRSMEDRRLNGHKTGAARSGRRLVSELQNNGFELIAYGSSDWNMTPIHGRYRDKDQTCIASLLEMINKEATLDPQTDPDQLAAWFANRMSLLAQQKLGMIVHQLDILAKRA